jgi:hypothetical protein
LVIATDLGSFEIMIARHVHDLLKADLARRKKEFTAVRDELLELAILFGMGTTVNSVTGNQHGVNRATALHRPRNRIEFAPGLLFFGICSDVQVREMQHSKSRRLRQSFAAVRLIDFPDSVCAPYDITGDDVPREIQEFIAGDRTEFCCESHQLVAQRPQDRLWKDARDEFRAPTYVVLSAARR